MTLRAAAASSDITPVPGAILQGHWNLNPSHSVFQPLELRALVLEHEQTRVAILTIDALGVSRELTSRVRSRIYERAGIPAQHIMVCASHAHCAPALLPIMQMQPDTSFMRSVEDAAVDCVTRACGELQPAQICLGAGSAYFNVNRRPLPGTTDMFPNDAAVIDHRARVLGLASMHGTPIATLFHFVCHPTTSSGSDGCISSDYPGIVRSRIDEQVGGKAMFIPGCFANVRPRMIDKDNRFRSGTPEEVHCIGDQLASAVIHAVQSMRWQPLKGTLVAAEVPLELRFASPASTDVYERVLVDQTPIGQHVRLPWARQVLKMLGTNSFPKSEATTMQAMRIGPLTLISIPGEPVLEIGLSIERLHSSSESSAIWSVGYTNDMLGYFCTTRQHEEGGYEPNAYVYFTRPAPFKDEQTSILTAARALVEELSL